MWIYNSNFGKWSSSSDALPKSSFDLLKQELSATRFYSRVLSGATFMTINNLDDIYDILGEWEPRGWYVSSAGSQYTDTSVPAKFAKSIEGATSYEYYTKFIAEYGLTLKNLFTGDRLIKDSVKNYYGVDLATTEAINLTAKITQIDGQPLKQGHKVLVKDQKTTETLIAGINPEEYFLGSYSVVEYLGASTTYEYFNSENGIYVYDGELLKKDPLLDDYSNCVRYSVYVGMGSSNAGKQYHLRRLLNGYYPVSNGVEPIEFVEKHNWLLRNRVDYNNLFEINYYDVIKHGTQSYEFNGVTYSIPSRTIAVGEFGVILNTQNLSGQQGTSNIIANKYKVNLRSITQTSKYYWIVGDESVMLKVRKHDFFVEKIAVDTLSNLTSVAFYNDLRGAAVGELNTILITTDGGQKWDRLRIADFAPYTYNKLIFTDTNRFYIGGRNGVFLELFEDIGGWTAYKRRIFKEIDDDDEYLLVDGINDLYKTTINTWGLSYSFGSTQSTATEKEIVFIAANSGSLIAFDTKDATDFDFLYLDFGKSYGDIRNITRQSGTNDFYFTGDDGLYKFDINIFKYIGVGNTYSNTIAGTYATLVTDLYANEIFDYEGGEILLCGNNSLLRSATYSQSMEFKILDEEFESRLKSKMLFMDYDIGAKLNWFTDQGDYRLPNSVTFSAIDPMYNGSLSIERLHEVGFSPLVYGPTAPSMATQSECNWLTYWIDDLKTFEYYSEYPLNEYELTGYTSSMVLISTTFSSSYDLDLSVSSPYPRSNNTVYISSDNITNSYSEIERLAPSFGATQGESRYSKFGGPSIQEPLNILTELGAGMETKLYLYDYLMILRLPLYSSKKYMVKVGDVYRMESDIVESNFVVNKIWESSNARYVYMYSEFNQSIITDLVQNAGTAASPKIKLTNLNVFTDINQLVYNFGVHPVGLAYEMKISASASGEYMLRLNPKFNNLTSYYNLAGNVSFNNFRRTYTMSGFNQIVSGTIDEYSKEMVYTGGFLKFGYTPTYNLLDYMESINKYSQVAPVFYASKEYLALPVYKDIPLGSLSSSNAYIDSNGITQSDTTGNKILFGEGLKLEWQSIMLNTFVDVSIYQPSAGGTYDTNRLLVMNKYKVENIDGLGISAYVVEFHKKLNFQLGTDFEGGSVDIKSRRTLQQISDDLQEMNNIHRARLDVNYIANDTLGYRNYQRELNFKVPTDSYAKAFLSDPDTVESLSAILYIDYKHELSMNITKLDIDFNVPIGNTAELNGELFISCKEKHGLSKGDGVSLEFDGGADSSQYLNQNYFGYRVVTQVYGEYDFTVDLPYGNDVYVGADTGYVRYVKRDPFLNFQPIDLIDIGLDKKGKIAIELSPENLVLKNGKFSLQNVDFTKYRYRLIDGLTIEALSVTYPWILEAEISGAVMGLDANKKLVWYKGIWEGGRWFGGTWISGTWKYGDWYDGVWNSKTIKDKKLTVEIDEKSSDAIQSTWFTGRWFGGTWNNGTWANGRFYDGTWNDGVWNNGIWNDGTWNNGRFIGGIWVDGEWNNGIFNTDNEPAYWIDGEWSGGDFENGMWYNGSFETKNAPSRFGTKAYNSRTATWHGGKWLSGSFHSKLGSAAGPSEVHKYSMWYTGQWMSGDFYGGVAYSIDFKSGTWHGGILEDIQIIGMDENNNSFILNGIFKFNIGDEFYVIDNEATTELSSFGSNADPKRYTVLYTVEDSVNKFTEVYVATNISDFSGKYVSYKNASGALNKTIGFNTFGTSSIYVSDAQDNIKDVKVKINLNVGNLIAENTVPVAQYKITAGTPFLNSTTFPSGTPTGNILALSTLYPAEPLRTQQSAFLSQNIVGVRKSNSTGDAVFHWGMTPNGYSGPGYTLSEGSPMSYKQNSTMFLYYGSTYKGQSRVLDPITRDAISTSFINAGTTYSTNDEIYSYAIDISEDPSFGSFYGSYTGFDVGMTYSFTAIDLVPNRYYYFRVYEVRSSGIGGLRINLKSPSGRVVGVKDFNKGNTDTDMIGTVFTYDQSSDDFDSGAPIYRGSYSMDLNESVAMGSGWTGTSSYILGYDSSSATASNGEWTLYIENTSGLNTAKLEDWEIQFGYSDHIGARLGDRKVAFDTGLRLASKFSNAIWKSGIWTNGIFDDGLFEAGIWYNGIFGGTWG